MGLFDGIAGLFAGGGGASSVANSVRAMPAYSNIANAGFQGNAGPAKAPASATDNPYGLDYTQSTPEQEAGVNPAYYNSMLGANNQLKAPYAVDPTKSDAFNQMAKTAQDPNLSPWAQLQMQQNTAAAQQQRDSMGAQVQGTMQGGLNQLESTGGGVDSGSALYLASQAGRNQMMGNQQIAQQQQQNALGIQGTDAQNKQNMLGQVANTETGAQAANAQTAAQDTGNANAFVSNRYNQLMGAWGAQQTAKAQAAAAASAGGGGKGK